jgi:Domain of unknown function (DUF4926)
MESIMKLLDVFALLEDVPNCQLYRGQVGTIVEVYEPKVFEVEFSDLNGRAYAIETLTENQLMVLYHHPIQERELVSTSI